MKLQETVFLPCAFGSLERNEAIAILENCIAKLPPELKKILAMHYYENLQLIEIADCFGVTECEVDQIRAETLGFLQTMLATQIGLPEDPAPPWRWESAEDSA